MVAPPLVLTGGWGQSTIEGILGSGHSGFRIGLSNGTKVVTPSTRSRLGDVSHIAICRNNNPLPTLGDMFRSCESNAIREKSSCRGLSAPLGRFGPRGRERERSALDFMIASSQDSLEVLVFCLEIPNYCVIDLDVAFCEKHQISLADSFWDPCSMSVA